jgi:G3E family GTPase
VEFIILLAYVLPGEMSTESVGLRISKETDNLIVEDAVVSEPTPVIETVAVSDEYVPEGRFTFRE